MRKRYASQESVAETLTQSELGTSVAHPQPRPFALAAPDGEPLPAVTRAPIVVEGETLSTIDPHTGETIHVIVMREAAE